MPKVTVKYHGDSSKGPFHPTPLTVHSVCYLKAFSIILENLTVLISNPNTLMFTASQVKSGLVGVACNPTEFASMKQLTLKCTPKVPAKAKWA